MLVAGRQSVRVSENKDQAEAEYRYLLTRLRENGGRDRPANWRTFIIAKSFSCAATAAQGLSAMSTPSAARAALDSSAAEEVMILGLLRCTMSN